jgi:cytidylate kinase
MKTDYRIIGLSGTNGAGKDTVGHLLAEHYNYWFISVTDLLREEVRRRGLVVNREHLRQISAEWRRQYGLAVLVDRAIEAFSEQTGYVGVVMSSLRNVGEVERLHELGGTLVWVDADPKIRYQRVRTNAQARGRAAEDDKTFEQFLADEAAEMHRPEGADEATLNMAEVKGRADIFLENNNKEREALRRVIEAKLDLDNREKRA